MPQTPLNHPGRDEHTSLRRKGRLDDLLTSLSTRMHFAVHSCSASHSMIVGGSLSFVTGRDHDSVMQALHFSGEESGAQTSLMACEFRVT